MAGPVFPRKGPVARVLVQLRKNPFRFATALVGDNLCDEFRFAQNFTPHKKKIALNQMFLGILLGITNHNLWMNCGCLPVIQAAAWTCRTAAGTCEHIPCTPRMFSRTYADDTNSTPLRGRITPKPAHQDAR